MSVAHLHSRHVPSNSSKAAAEVFNACAIDLLRDPLSVSPDDYLTVEQRIAAVCEFLLNGVKTLDARELRFMRRLGVPRALVMATGEAR